MIGITKKWVLVLIHILFWIGYGFILLNWLSFGFDFFSALPLVCRTLLIQSILFYANIGILLPKLLERNRYFWYMVAIVAMVVLAYLAYEFSNYLPVIRDAVYLPNIRFVVHRFGTSHRGRPFPFHRRFFGPWLYTNIFSSLAFLFISTIYWVINQSRKRQQWELSLKNENLQTELKFLKSQINPHFLFNALNNIYSLSYTKSPKAPELIMKLSGMLRYMLYENNGKKVMLKDEIRYIMDYISFQRLKMETDPNITLDFNQVDENLLVEPMIFIPFIENSFKHSNLDDHRKGWIRMKMESTGTRISFALSNSIPSRRFTKDKTGGIGLQNIRKRLELLYPGRHLLSLNELPESFEVQLTIETV